MNTDKTSIEFLLLSEYATCEFNRLNCRDEIDPNKWLNIKSGIARAIELLKIDPDQKLRYAIDINGRIKGYQNMNKMTFKAYFNSDMKYSGNYTVRPKERR